MIWKRRLRKEEILLDLFMDLVPRRQTSKSQTSKKRLGVIGCRIQDLVHEQFVLFAIHDHTVRQRRMPECCKGSG